MSKSKEELLLDWSRAGFEDLDREQLKQAAEMLGVTFVPGTNNTTMQRRLREAIGTVEGTLPEAEISEIKAAVPSRPKLGLHATPPNLSPAGRWGGRYRRVRLVRTDYYKDFKAFPIGWEGVIRYFHFDTDLDMAWPWYESLRNMIQVTLVQTITPDGHHNLSNEQQGPVVPFSDLGDVPGTEALPRSMREYVQWLAAAEDNFAKTDRRDLMRIMRLLHGTSINAKMKDLSDDDIRDAILTFLGVDIYEAAA